MNTKDQILTVIEGLNNTLKVCSDAVQDKERGYPFATGYFRSTVESTVKSLETIMQELE